MFELQGKYNTARVFTDNVEETAMSQIIELCNQEFVKGSKIRIMPDTHAGAGCTIGTTMTIQDKIVPNLVGVDIGCGMYVVRLIEKALDLEKLDNIIKHFVPSGFETRKTEHGYNRWITMEALKCLKEVNTDRAKLSIGTLGGGNHFIEVNKDEYGVLYLVIHSGSRNLGKQVAEYYQDLGYQKLINKGKEIAEIVKKYKAKGRQSEIQAAIKAIKTSKFSKMLAWVEGEDFNNYLHDMNIVQNFASWNRKAIAREILDNIGIHETVCDFETIHNYINTKTMILRKGAISAQKDEKVIIPINMRDGSLLCYGRGNEDWNCSAPHGAGRLMSRSKAKELVTLNEFKSSMEGIYTTSVGMSTLDESPMAYKSMQEIIENIDETVVIDGILKPIYNFKAGE